MKFLLSRNFIFPTSAVVGLLVGSLMDVFSFLNMPIMMLIMTLSLSEIDFSKFKDFSKMIKPFFIGIGLNYFLIFFLLLVLGRLFVLEDKIWAGLVFTAATPPGLAIIPFTLLVKANLFYSSVATFSSFLAALLFTPYLATYFMNNDAIGFFDIFKLLFILLIIPLIIGRILRIIKWQAYVKKIHSSVVNLGFGIIFAVILGVNKNLILSDPFPVLKLLIISIISVFGIGLLTKLIVSKMKMPIEIKKSIILVASIKNSIFGATTGLVLIGPKGALAGIVMTFVLFIYLIFLDKIVK